MFKKSPLTYIALVFILTVSSIAMAQQANDINPPLSVQWVFSMGPDPGNITTPVIARELVFISHRGIVRGLDFITGGEKWQFKPENAAVTTAPVIYGELAIVGASDGSVYALRAENGNVVWRFICAGPIAADPIIFNDMLVVGAGEFCYTINPGNGQGGWLTPLSAPVALGPVSDGTMLYFIGTNGSVQCVDGTTGRYRWGTLLTISIRVFKPVVAGNRVIVATGNRVYGLARSGAIGWTVELPAGVGATPLVRDEYLLVPCLDGEIYTLVARSGGPQRHLNFKIDHPITSTPAITETILALGTGEGLVYMLDRKTGEPVWFYRCRDPKRLPYEANPFGIYSPMLIQDGSMFCLVGSGDLYRFTASAPDYSGPVFSDFLPEPGSAMPGGQFIYPQCSVVDDGSGVDPNSINATLNGTPTPVSFDVATGVAALRETLLSDGAHIVRITAKDFRGNETSAEWSFVTETSLLPSPAQSTGGQTTRGLARPTN